MSTFRRHRDTARRILGSLGVLAAAAAVAGLGTFGTFTDSTSVDTSVQSGTLSIKVGAPGGIPHVIPVTTSGFLPGDSLTRPLNLDNDGTVALSTVALATTATPSSALVTDPVNGLQLTLQQCSRRWTQGGTELLPAYTCDGTQRTFYSGPVVSTAALPTPNSLAPGGTDNMIFTLSLPPAGGNDMQNLSATVQLAFTAVQAPGTAR
jgi:predicted ribosomally synthesized peptide with SipW-like signal peptide